MRWLDGITDSVDVSLRGDGEGQGSLACCSPWDYKESDVTFSDWTTASKLWHLSSGVYISIFAWLFNRKVKLSRPQNGNPNYLCPEIVLFSSYHLTKWHHHLISCIDQRLRRPPFFWSLISNYPASFVYVALKNHHKFTHFFYCLHYYCSVQGPIISCLNHQVLPTQPRLLDTFILLLSLSSNHFSVPPV